MRTSQLPLPAQIRRTTLRRLPGILFLGLLVVCAASAEEKPSAVPPLVTPATTNVTAGTSDGGPKPAAESGPKPEEPAVTELRKTGFDLIAKILANQPPTTTVDLMINGDIQLVDLVEIDKKRTLRFKQFGKKSEIPFEQVTTTQVAGILSALTTDEFADAGKAHVTIGLLYAVEGRSLESSSEIAKAIQLDDSLDQYASEQLKVLPKPPPPPNASPDITGLAGISAGSSTSSMVSSRVPNFPVGPWESVGYGGGGSMYTPVISPHDPKIGIVSCDMAGIYLTRDGGRHWQILPRMRYGRGIAFSPSDPNVIFVGTSSMIYRSADLGLTWKTVTTDYQYPMCFVWDCCVDPDDGNSVWAAFGFGTIEAGFPQMACKLQIERSTDAGNTFIPASEGLSKDNGIVRKLAVDRSTSVGNRTLYAATSVGFFRSQNHGASWTAFGGKGLPGTNLRDILTLYNKAAKKTIILVVMETGGLFRSEDGGATFQPSGAGIGDKPDGTGLVLNALGASWVDHQTVWAAGAEIWKSTDSGKTWKSFYDEATKFAGCMMVNLPGRYCLGYGIGCSPKNPNYMWYTGVGYLIGTTDGGATLTELSSTPMPEGTPRYSFTGPRGWKNNETAPTTYDGGNLEVCFTYQVIPDPFDSKIWYAGYADTGLWRTADGGTSWSYSLGRWGVGIKPEWRNSTYDVAPDPKKSGRLYAVCSGHHNLPRQDIVPPALGDLGGVAITDDHGKTWQPLEKSGLPERCMTSILIDQRSGAQNTLWVTVYMQGVWRSTDDGGTFVNMSKGLPSEIRAWRLRQAADGSILLLTANQKPGGIWKYDDKTGQWALLPATKPFTSVVDLIAGPKGFMAVAVGESAPPAKDAESDGGIFASYDNGATWKKLLAGNFNSVDRTADGQWWFATGHRKGLWRSLDGGATWTEDKDLPYIHLNDVTINPKNRGELWLGSSGCGVFKGSSIGTAGASPGAIANPSASNNVSVR